MQTVTGEMHIVTSFGTVHDSETQTIICWVKAYSSVLALSHIVRKLNQRSFSMYFLKSVPIHLLALY